ncbi:hypothetical protein ACX6XY_16245 [Streptomyces sp. O3]
MPGWAMLLAAVLLIAAATVGTWWLIGQQTLDVADPDYAVRPWNIPDDVEKALGAGAMLTLAVTVPLFVEWTRIRRLEPAWWSVLGPLLAVGAVAALGQRVMTAEVIGANIGAGLVVLFGAPVAALVTVLSLGRAAQLARRSRPPRT